MNKRELKKLGRAELLEMLIVKIRENDHLRAELEEAKKMPPQSRAAEESFSAGNVLHALNAAAEQYLSTMRRLSEQTANAEETKNEEK